MIRTDTGEILGPFEFDQLPRVGETVSVPAIGDPEGFRSFDVRDIDHVAAGVTGHAPGLEAPGTLITCDEIG